MHNLYSFMRYNYEKLRFRLYSLAQRSDILTRTPWDLPGDYPKRVCLALLTVVCHPWSWRKRVRQSLKDYSDKRRQQESPAHFWVAPPPQELAVACSEMWNMLRKGVTRAVVNGEFHGKEFL